MKIIKDSVDHFMDYGVHIESRTIYIGDSTGDGVDAVMADYAIKGLHLLVAADKEKPIKIILNSNGGCEFNGMGIYDAIKACPCQVTIEVMGAAMSMASIILQAADVRVLHPNAIVMVHDGYIESGAVPPKIFEAWARYSSKVSRKLMYDIYAERSGKPASYWEKRCAQDYILTARQAVEEGLADRLIGEEEDSNG